MDVKDEPVAADDPLAAIVASSSSTSSLNMTTQLFILTFFNFYFSLTASCVYYNCTCWNLILSI